MTSRIRWIAVPVLVACFSLESAGQAFVSSNGGPPTMLTTQPAPPVVTAPPCAPIPPPCPLAFVPPFPPGVFPPSLGGEAVDEATGMTYVTDGLIGIGASPYPTACAIAGPFFPFGAWPPGPCGPIGPPGPPIVAMSDAAGVGTLWVLDAAGLVSLIPFPPGPPIAQAFAPLPVLPTPMSGPTGIAFDPAGGMLWFTGAFVPLVVGTPVPVGFACAPPLPAGFVFPIPPCLPPPWVGITVQTAAPPLPPPANLFVSNGIILGDLFTGVCPCPVLPPAVIPTTDIDFADLPYTYGAGCGCGPPAIGFAGGYPVLGNGAFAVTAAGIGPGVAVGALFLSIAPALPPIPIGPCPLNLSPLFLLLLPPLTPVLPVGPPPCPGTVTYPLPIPAGPPGLVGVPLFLQWVLFPNPAGPLPFELSDGLELTIGFP